MHIGISYKLSEFIIWTRRNIFRLVPLGVLPVVLYQILGWRWAAIPWTGVALIGTAAAFLIGFKNTQTYNRTWEARQIWGSILNASRTWGVQCRDFMENNIPATKILIYRHFAWLTALRYQMRDARAWENAGKPHNVEYSRFYKVPEREIPLETELAKYLSPEELSYVLSTKNRAAQIMSLQSKTLRELADAGHIDNFRFLELQKLVGNFTTSKGAASVSRISPTLGSLPPSTNFSSGFSAACCPSGCCANLTNSTRA